MLRTENVHFRKTNKNTVVKRVREGTPRLLFFDSYCPLVFLGRLSIQPPNFLDLSISNNRL